MFLAALFIHNCQKLAKMSFICTDKRWYICIMKWYLAIKKNEPSRHKKKWRNLKYILLSEAVQKDSLIYDILENSKLQSRGALCSGRKRKGWKGEARGFKAGKQLSWHCNGGYITMHLSKLVESYNTKSKNPGTYLAVRGLDHLSTQRVQVWFLVRELIPWCLQA